jgi:hypothetical protein
MEARLHGPSRDPEDLGQLGDRAAFEVMQHEERPLLDGEPPHRQVKQGRIALALVWDGGVRHPPDPAGRDLADAASTSRSVGHPRRVDRDPLEPRVEAIRLAQVPDLPPRGDERLLRGVAGIGLVAQDGEGQSVHGIGPGAHDLLERVEVAVAGPVDDRPVGRGADRLPPEARSTI